MSTSNYPATATPGGPDYKPDMPLPSSGYPATSTPGGPTSTNPVKPIVDTPDKEVGVPAIEGVPPGSNIRDRVQFNCAIPKIMSAVGYKNPKHGTSHRSIYRKNQLNAKGMIVRDFNMSAKLEAAGAGWASTQENWGFQFHYNPNSVSESFSPPAGMDYYGFIMDIATSPIMLVSAQTGAVVTFEILLLRWADMRILNRPDWRDHYPEVDRPTPEDREEILAKGTQYDIERFFRVVNLDPVQTWRNDEKTSDWGMLMATPVIISLGDSEGCLKYRAQPASVTVTHMMYAPGMIPVYSKLTFSFTRVPDMYAVEGYDAPAVESAAPGGSGAFSPNYPTDQGSGRPKGEITLSGGVKGTSSYGHYLHRAATQTFPEFTNWGTYASGGNHGHGRALDIMCAVSPRDRNNPAWKLAEWFTGYGVSNFAVTQVIFQQQIWTAARKNEGWRPMEDRGSDNANHFNHIHVSFGPESDNTGGSINFKQNLQLYTSKEFWEKNGGSGTGSSSTGAASGSLAERNQAIARPMFTTAAAKYGWSARDWDALVTLWNRESSWNHLAKNASSGAYGIPQSLPGDKMSSEGSDWRTNPSTQVAWGLKYIKSRHGSPIKALQHSDQKGWY